MRELDRKREQKILADELKRRLKEFEKKEKLMSVQTKALAKANARVAILTAKIEEKDAALEKMQRKFESLNVELEETKKRFIKNERGFRKLIENAPFAVMLINGKKEIMDVNTAALNIIERKKEDVVGRTCHEFICPLEEGNCPVVDGGKSIDRNEGVILRADGQKIPVLKSATGVELEGEKFLIESFIDISAQKKARDLVRQTEERFLQVIESAQEWAWETNADGLYTFASSMAEKILGYKSEELVGHKHFYDLFCAENRQELKEVAFEAFAKKQPFRNFINRNVHKNGEIVWLSTNAVPLLDERGNLLGYRGIDVDITESHKAQESLKKYAADMEALNARLRRTMNKMQEKDQRIQESTDELHRAYRELKEKTNNLERFHKVTVARELIMIELKQEINLLLERLGQPKKYAVVDNIKKSKYREM